ncbi:MAG: hypothetical protein ACE5J2_04780 [Nitrososphaerales archaeon]
MELSRDWFKKVREDLALLAEHEQKLEVAWKAYEALNENSPYIEGNKSLKAAAKHALQACTELLRLEIQMIGKISPKIANELEGDLNKWQRKAVKGIEEKGSHEQNDSARIIDIRNRVQLVRTIMQDTMDSLEEYAKGY